MTDAIETQAINARVSEFLQSPTPHLDLSGLGIEDIPQALIDFVQAEHYLFESVNLSRNGMTAVPANLEGLAYDQSESWTLDFSHNEISDFSALLGMGIQLKRIIVAHCPIGNQLEKLVGGWKKALFEGYVTEMDLSGCQLTEIPEQLENTRVQYLDLSDNQLTHIPPINKRGLGGVRVYLANNQLTELPAWLLEQDNLDVLDVRGNPLTLDLHLLAQMSKLRVVMIDPEQISGDIPKDIPKGVYAQDACMWLPKQSMDDEYFWLPYAGLHTIPDFVGKMPKLRHFNVEDSPKLTELPAGLSNAKHLQEIDVSHTSIRDLTVLSELTELQDIKANHTLVEEVPEAVVQLPKLNSMAFDYARLTHLPIKPDLTITALYCRITALPSDFAKLNTHQTLNLAGNRIAHLPDDLGPKLSQLNLHNNLVEALPESLEKWQLTRLVLINNCLRKVPEDIFTIESLALGGNPLDGVPNHVAKRGGARLLEALKTGAVPKAGAEIYAELFEQNKAAQYDGQVPEIDREEELDHGLPYDELRGEFLTEFPDPVPPAEGYLPLYYYESVHHYIYYAVDTSTPQYTVYKYSEDLWPTWQYHSDSLEDFLDWFETPGE